MIPVIKGWLSEVAQEVTSLGLQVHGGMGFVEETGAAQYLRDVRITPIYEGTNGIQAADLVSRKLGRDGGATMEAMQADIKGDGGCAGGLQSCRIAGIGSRAGAAHWRVTCNPPSASWRWRAMIALNALGGAFDYMMQTGYLFGGWHLGRSALVAADSACRGGENPVLRTENGNRRFLWCTDSPAV